MSCRCGKLQQGLDVSGQFLVLAGGEEQLRELCTGHSALQQILIDALQALDQGLEGGSAHAVQDLLVALLGHNALLGVALTLYSPSGENSVPTKTIIKYGELIEEATGGAVKCDVQYGGTLGNDAEAIESTRMGTIDLIFAGTSGFTSFYDKAKVMDLPFLFTSAEEANEVLNSTDIGEQIFADFGDYDLVYLAEGDNGMRHVSTVKSWGQIEKADDVIGLKIRVPQSQMYTDCWSTLGATPVALALTELTTALSNGTAQAQDNATYHEVANATWDDIGYFSFINYMWMGCTMAANKIAWDKLNETTQNVLREKAKEAAQFSFDCIAEDNVTARKTMEEGGVQFCDNPDIDSFKKKLDIPAYYTRYASEAWYDQSLVDTIYNYGNK